MPINGVAVGAISIGGVFLYSAIKGKSVLASSQAIITGKSPTSVLPTNQIITPVSTGITDATNPGNTQTSGGGSAVANTGTNQSILQNTAAGFGWGSGAEWSALDWIELAEAGYSSTIANGTSGALGMAQALGHGNANTHGTLGNEYGGFGLSDAQAKLANSGNAAMQALWMCNYIKTTYVDPIKAKAFHQAHHYY